MTYEISRDAVSVSTSHGDGCLHRAAMPQKFAENHLLVPGLMCSLAFETTRLHNKGDKQDGAYRISRDVL